MKPWLRICFVLLCFAVCCLATVCVEQICVNTNDTLQVIWNQVHIESLIGGQEGSYYTVLGTETEVAATST